jgi:LAO/AO transport system kinase
MQTIAQLRKGDKRTIAQTITDVENNKNTGILKKLFSYTGHAYHIGITGPPGAGKSTLVNAVAKRLVSKDKKIGIIAVDPTSPFSGGALLGDRIRMSDLALNEHVFIRSMASRGSLGGLARKTKDAALVLDAAGMDYILIETIGVGQVELDIAEVCDTTVVVLVPESGDSIQAMKAGLLEIADIIAVNKGDRSGCDRLLMELKFAFDLRPQEAGWHFPILKTTATRETGLDTLVKTILKHQAYLEKSGRLEQNRKAKLFVRINELIRDRVAQHLMKNLVNAKKLKNIIDSIYRRKMNPYSIAESITRKVINYKSSEVL